MTDQAVSKPDSKERVALELMHYIVGAEGTYPKGDAARKYYLDLYHQCWRMAAGREPK